MFSNYFGVDGLFEQQKQKLNCMKSEINLCPFIMKESIENDVFDEDADLSFTCHQRRPRLESQLSICLPSKGLLNAPGENNCFLNASVQILWHLNVFRRSFRLYNGHTCLGNACIFCALKRIFKEFEDSDATALAPDALRQALANAFSDNQRFQLGQMDDAAECFENILSRLHGHIAHKEFEDTCSAKYCISHQKFALHILEQTSCQCQATSEPKFFYQFVTYVSASVLVNLANRCKSDEEPFTFGQLIRSAYSGESRPCPDEKRCLYKKSAQRTSSVQTTLINKPDIVTIGISWDTNSPSSKYVANLLECIGENQNLFLIDLFDNIPDDEYKRLELQLVGLVAYYGKHYVSFFYNNREKQWIYFDDERVKKIGSQWSNILSKCRRNRFQPLLIIYSNSNGTTIDATEAPKQIEFVSKDIFLSHPERSSSTYRKNKSTHRHRHKKSRARSYSPSFQTNQANTETENPPLSPKPTKKRHSTSPRSPRKHQIHSPTVETESSFNENEEDEQSTNIIDLDSTDHASKSHPKHTTQGHLLNLVNSASDGCFPVKSFQDDVFEVGNLTDYKRPGSLKKKLSDVIKINSKTKKSIKNNKNPHPVFSTSPDEITFADIGYDFPPNNISNHNVTNLDKQYSLDKSNSGKQLHNLQKHQELLVKSSDKPGDLFPNVERQSSCLNKQGSLDDFHPKSNSTLPSKTLCSPVVSKKVHQSCEEDRNSRHNRHEERREEEDLIHFNSRPAVIKDRPPSYDTYKRMTGAQGKFERLVNVGEELLLESEKFERDGDIFLAVQRATAATATFRSASKLEGINSSLVQFVDDKRSYSYKRSTELSTKANELIANPATKTFPTSDYGSLSSPEPNASVINNNMHDFIDLQNHNAQLQAMARLSIKPTATTIPLTLNSTSHAPNTSIRWVIDKPNESYVDGNNYPSSDTATDIRTAMQRNPKLYTPIVHSQSTYHFDDVSNMPNKSTPLPANPDHTLVNSMSNRSTRSERKNNTSLLSRQTVSGNSLGPVKLESETGKTDISQQLTLPNRPDAMPQTKRWTSSKSLPAPLSNVTSGSPSEDDSPRETIYDDIIDEDYKKKPGRAETLINLLNNDANVVSTNQTKPMSYTLEKLKENNKSKKRCIKCNWRYTEEGTVCRDCLSSTDKAKIESATLQKMRTKNQSRCIQCGWKVVSTEGLCCDACQSEYL